MNYDIEFLKELDKNHLQTHYAKIQLLTFDEKAIKEIQGIITSGTLNVNGSSTVRRTINLNVIADDANKQIDELQDEDIAINKKIKIYIGLKNTIKSYKQYGDIVWFPCGVFIISTATISRQTSGWSISINGKDKMCLLDGTAGGVFPASITFNKSTVALPNGDYEIIEHTVYRIIYEAVQHWGGESDENIIISDLDEEVKMLVRYMGSNPIYFSENYQSLSFQSQKEFPNIKYYGEDAGYEMTDFTYPADLVLNAGDTVVSLLDKIVKTLGNYEFFYDIDGKFRFQQIKNYLNTGSPLDELTEDNYIKSYNNAKFLYSLTDLDSTTTITKNPKYDNIKNDFYACGQRKTATGQEVFIRYHLAIDNKPEINLANKYMWKVFKNNTIVRYDFNNINEHYTVENYETELISIPCQEWREELYRQALNAQVTNSVYDNYYDSELIAEWRNLYNPMNESWKDGWNPDVRENPGKLNYWLDFIDTGSEISRYSVKKIGRRTKVKNDTSLKILYNKEEYPDIVFIKGFDEKLIEHYNNMGQKYFLLVPQLYDMFSISTTGASCFDKIREMLYQNLSYNTTISISCLPKYYIEPNNIIYIEDEKSGIMGNYQITQYSLPLTYNGLMNITATEVLTRV